MDSSSLLLLSLAFMQFVSAADQNNAAIKAEPGDNVILPCKDPDQGKIFIAEWKRTDLGTDYVLLYKDEKITPDAQHPSYMDRVDLLLNQIRKGDASLILKNTTTDDSGTYECRVYTEKHVDKLISTISLVVAPRPPEPFPVWATVLLGLLVLLVLVAAPGVSFYFWLRWKPVPEQKEEEPGKKFVLLPFKVPHRLWFCKYRRSVAKVEWKDGNNRTVHVYQNGSDQPGEQDEFYRTRTKMNLLKNGDLSLTLRRPTYEDGGIYTCSVSNKDRDVLMEKQVWLKVKVPEVVVESGVESVKLPWRTTEDLDGDAWCVEWMDGDNRMVHMYQNGFDQLGEQHQIYRGRTRMDKNLLETKDLGLTLEWPTNADIYTCRVYNRDRRDILMVKQVLLQVKAHQVEVESGVESVKLPWRPAESLYGNFRVEWKNRYDYVIHVYQNGSDQPGDQDQRYRTRTKMDENPLKTGDLSLTLSWPRERDGGIYTCIVYSSDGFIQLKKQLLVQVKVQQVEVEPGVESVLLPCRTTEDLDGDVRVEWMDGWNRKVHVYENGSDQPEEQHQDYKDRTKMEENLLKNKDLSLTLRRPTYEDENLYTCRVSRGSDVLMEKDIRLRVKVPKMEVKSGVESVLLPCRTTEDLDGDVRVEWMDGVNNMVHVYQNGSDQPGEQDPSYKGRTKMEENLLENKDLSLILKWPTDWDSGIYTCRVSNRDGVVLMVKEVQLKVKVQQVEVKSGDESVLLPFRTTEDLDGDVRVEWMDKDNRTVHVYQNGSDQPGEQDQFYRTRTRMEENLLKNGDLSLTLRRPRERDSNTFTCRVSNRKGDVLMKKKVQLQVKAGTVQVQPEDIMEPLLADQLV